MQYHLSFFPNWDESHLYWSNTLNLNLEQRVKFSPKEGHFISAHVNIPLILGLSRPERTRDYKMDDFTGIGILKSLHSQPTFRYFGNSFQIYTHILYEFPKKCKGVPGVHYQFSYMEFATKNSEKFQSSIHTFGLT